MTDKSTEAKNRQAYLITQLMAKDSEIGPVAARFVATGIPEQVINFIEAERKRGTGIAHIQYVVLTMFATAVAADIAPHVKQGEGKGLGDIFGRAVSEATDGFLKAYQAGSLHERLDAFREAANAQAAPTETPWDGDHER